MLECRASVSSRAKPLGVVSVRFQAASTITTNFAAKVYMQKLVRTNVISVTVSFCLDNQR
jgi:hypothetical protein